MNVDVMAGGSGVWAPRDDRNPHTWVGNVNIGGSGGSLTKTQ